MAKYDGTYIKKDKKGRPRRYAVCKECKREWNIAKEQKVPKLSYICPECERRIKHERTISNAAGRCNGIRIRGSV